MSTNQIKGSNQAINTALAPVLWSPAQAALCLGEGEQSRAMWLLSSFRAGLAWALLSLVLGMELSLQESLLLKSLGLSTKPNPKSPIPVPSVLWRIFQKRKMLPSTDKDVVDACRVEEFNVPGNIIRVFADQGTAAPWFGSCLLEATLVSGLGRLCSSPSFSVSWVWVGEAGGGQGSS